MAQYTRSYPWWSEGMLHCSITTIIFILGVGDQEPKDNIVGTFLIIITVNKGALYSDV